jgi:hypothetical protein
VLENSKELRLEVNTEKVKYMVVFRHQNVVQNHNLLIANKSFEMWQSSDIWKQWKQIKIAYTKKSRAD